ncbi:hypothetical protein [Halogranum rubrum]|uniref:Uncharacterized protein n=1 Tax=Halogranum salarium B-1 TaxID=1210908 RepID=J3JDU0_9EURY|nr:hypothetical protein [Halogranum salarium]EJN57781.1 hypothetical protein HSB1_38660 [Halogranum salarium B-1]
MAPSKKRGSKSIPKEPLRYYEGVLDLTFEEFSLDEDDEFFEIDSPGDEISLQKWEDDWETLTLQGSLEITHDLVEAVFPEDDREDPPAELVLAADCDKTHLREGHETDIANFTEGTHEVTVTVSDQRYAGSFRLHPILVRTEPGDPDADYRTLEGLALADGVPVRVKIDDVSEGGDRLLPSYFKSFSGSEQDRFPDDAVFVVDKSDLDRPKLFVNSDHESIRDALKSGPRGYVGHVMKVYRDLIFLPAFTELTLWTAQDVQSDGSTAHDWQDALLSHIGTRMYGVEDASKAGERLHEELHEDEAMTTLLDRTSRTLQEYFSVHKSMNKLVDRIR